MATTTFVVVSSMVGTGALTTTGYMLLDLRSGWLVLLVWLAGGILALCGALSLAEVAAALPRSGGEYPILREAYGPRVAFLSGWVALLLGFAGPIAASASAAASYTLAPLGIASSDRLAVRGLATLAVVVLTVVHALGRSHTARFQTAVTLAKLALLASLTAAGLLAAGGRWTNFAPRVDGASGSAILMALVYVSYSFSGWNGAAYIAGEVGDPGRRLPRAILLGTVIVTILYLGLNVVYIRGVSVESIQDLASREGRAAVEPIAELAARELFGPRWSRWLSLGVGWVLLGSLSAMILTGPRVAFAMARDGEFPAIAGRLAGPGQTPVAASAIVSAMALTLLWSGSFEWILLFSGIGLALFSLPTVGAVIVLRRSRPDLPRPFRVPAYPLAPAIFLVGTAALTAAAFIEHPRTSAVAVLAILAGLPIHAWVRRDRS